MTAAACTEPGARPTLLAVDDEPQILTAIEDLFEKDFDVVTATDGHTGLHLLERRAVSVVLSDQRLPGLKGTDFLAEAQKRSQASRVLITGYADYEALIEAVNRGRIFGYVAKPWDPDRFRSLVLHAHRMYRLVRALEEERRLLTGLMDNIPDHVFFKDLEARYLRVNHALARHYGRDRPEEFLGRRTCEVVPPEFTGVVDHVEALDRQVMAGGQTVSDDEHRLPDRATGTQRWFSTTRAPLHDDQGRVTGLVGISRDVTARRQAEEEVRLSLSLQRVRTAVMAIERRADWQAVLDCLRAELARFVDFDDCGVNLQLGDGRMLGGTAEEGFWFEASRAQAPVLAAIASGRVHYRQTAAQMRQAGDDPPLLEAGVQSVVDVPFAGGTVAMSSRRPHAFAPHDIEVLARFGEVMAVAQRRLADLEALDAKDRQLRQLQRLEAVGQLASGVAHDFGNLVTVISGNSQLLQRRFKDDAEALALVTEVRHAGERADALIRRLLAVGRQQSVAAVSLDLNQVVEPLLPLLDRLTGSGIRLKADLASRPLPVLGDQSLVEQVLLNLVVNARDASPGGGTVRIVTQELAVEPGGAAAPGAYAGLLVEDHGVGMSSAVRALIFEPFFTTKEGTGTGLGLATVQDVVRKMGGAILVDTEPGRGSRFTVLFPLLAGGAP